jgi:signal transduction histidine kinase/CheY-like chemotaxis protein
MTDRSSSKMTLKIIVTIILAIVAMIAFWGISEYNYKRISEPINQLSKPNYKLETVNKLFKKIVFFDQLQNTKFQASDNNEDELENEIFTTIHHLQALFSSDSIQLKRLQSLEQILQERKSIYNQFTIINQEYLANDSLNNKIERLLDFINSNNKSRDSALFTTQSSITSKVIEDSSNKSEKENFWSNLFKRKKNKPAKEIKHFILEQLKVSVDTLLLQHEDSIVDRLGQSIAMLESDRKKQLNIVINKRLQLEQANATLIHTMLTLLDELEQDVEVEMIQYNAAAKNIINDGIFMNKLILIISTFICLILLFLIINDIFKSNQYKKELLFQKNQAEALSAFKQKFLSNLSHELRTPLQSIIGYTELAEYKKNEDNFEIEHIKHASHHLLNVVNQVLDLGRINNQNFELKNETFLLSQLINEVCSIIQIKAKEKHLDFLIDSADHLNYLVVCDSFRLKQILLNLLDNAVKYTKVGSVELIISPTLLKENIRLKCIIKDTGIGISEDNLDKIFDDFHQLHEYNDSLGNGLGLSIVKELIQHFNGSITVNSKVGEGSIFIVDITLPLVKSDTQNELKPIQRPLGIEKGIVWIIDDDPIILEICQRFGSLMNLQIITFSDPLVALTTVCPNNLFAILIDMRMPLMNGIDFMKQFKIKPRNKGSFHISLIAFTAQVLYEEIDQFLQLGYDKVLLKPFTKSEFEQLLFACFEKNERISIDIEDDLFDFFIDQSKNDIHALLQEIELENLKEIREITHQLASRFAQVGLIDWSNFYRELEINAHSKKAIDFLTAHIICKKHLEELNKL